MREERERKRGGEEEERERGEIAEERFGLEIEKGEERRSKSGDD